MRKVVFLLIFVAMAMVSTSVAQIKTLQAIEVNVAPKLDGYLDEAAWLPIATSFITNTPVFGESSIVKTEVRILYDNTAVYIGLIYMTSLLTIRKQMTSRDGEQRQDIITAVF
jgi:hypothetical protein